MSEDERRKVLLNHRRRAGFGNEAHSEEIFYPSSLSNDSRLGSFREPM
jgi:hypothetical protein